MELLSLLQIYLSETIQVQYFVTFHGMKVLFEVRVNWRQNSHVEYLYCRPFSFT